MSLFVDVALRAASIVENNDFPLCECCPAGGLVFEKSCFCIYSIFFKLQNSVICLDLSLGSMLDSLVLKNAVECTSQRLKWTSGARVMTVVHAWFDVVSQ